MSTQTQLRRGTASQCDAMTPAEGEVIVDLTNDRLRLGDALAVGGKSHFPSIQDLQDGSVLSAVAGGTADALTVDLSPAIHGYVSKQAINFKVSTTNTGAATINVNSKGAKTIKKVSSGSIVDVAAGDLVAGAFYTVRYDGSTNFILDSSGSGSVTAGPGLEPGVAAGSIQLGLNNAVGVGSYGIYCVVSGNFQSGDTTSGSNLCRTVTTQAGINVYPGDTIIGTWRNMSAFNHIAGSIGLWMRVA